MTRKQWLTIIQKAITDIDGLEWEKGMNGLTTTIRLNRDEAVSLFTLLQTDIVHCEECEWWQKQDDSLQGRCAKYEFYPTGRYFCAGGERSEE